MRYATLHPATARRAASRRIGRCARCHAPVLSDEEHYGNGAALVHGACGAQPIDDLKVPAPAGPPLPQVRRTRRTASTARLHAPAARHNR